MGSTFVNVQVHARGREPEALLEGVVSCLQGVVGEDGFVAAGAGEACDRTVVVAVGTSWIGVYDQLCDGPRADLVERLAGELSRRLETHVVSVLVYDSDVLELGLFASGARIDRYDSNPDYFEKVSAAKRKSKRGKPERWSPVLAAGAEPAALDSAWRKEKLFAEETLRETAELLGLDKRRAQVGFRYLEQGDAELEDAERVTLGFRHAVRPAHEQRAEGAPQFEVGISSVKFEAALGHSTQFGSSVRSSGGASRGLSVVVFGDALDRGLLSITSVQLVVSLGEERTVLSAAPASELRGAQRVSVASFPDVAIAAGSAVAESAIGLEEAWDHYRSAMQLHANVFADAVSVGAGAVHLGFVPDGAFDGQAVISLQAEVFAAARLPLRAPAGAQPVPQLAKHVLFALLSLDLSRSEAAAVVAPMLERFCALLEPFGALSLVVFSGDRSTRPRTAKAKLSGLLRSAGWRKAKAELERAACVTGSREALVEDFFARRPSDGFSFGGSLLPREVAGDPELPTLALWFDLENAPAERALAAETLFEALTAEAMTRHSGVQALVGKTTAISGITLDRIDYESACGIHGGCTLRRSWLSRFLRAVPVGTLWLGESLASSIPDLKALEAAARVESFGRSLKVTIENEGALGAVEQALAPLLPSAEDWRRGQDRLYGRVKS